MKYINKKNCGHEKFKKSIHPNKNSLAYAITQVKEFLNNAQTPETERLVKISTICDTKSLLKTLKPEKNVKYIQNFDLDYPELTSTKNDLSKYWIQRYDLFSKFDEGIKMDEESWYSVTHECIANHIAQKTQNDIFMDVCCGVGSSCIQAANSFLQVFGIDNDMHKLEAAKHNAIIYGVANYIDFIFGDYFQVLKTFRRPFIDVLFIDMPWGGPEYLNKDIYNCITDMPLSLRESLNLCAHQTSNIMIGLPRNTSLKSIGQLVEGRPFEVEKNFLKRRLKRLTVYTGSLVKPDPRPSHRAQEQKETEPAGVAPAGEVDDAINGQYLCDFERRSPARFKTDRAGRSQRSGRKINTVWNIETTAEPARL